MVLLLRPGDPLPALHLPGGKLDPREHAGKFWLLTTHPVTTVLPYVLAADPVSARRLGALAGEALVVLVDPAGKVVQSWAEGPVDGLVAAAEAVARRLGGA